MDGKPGGVRRKLRRASEPNRLEDQVWTLAYEQIWPLVRKVLRSHEPAVLDEPGQRLAETAGLARRA
jgi:hypothetical protein